MVECLLQRNRASCVFSRISQPPCYYAACYRMIPAGAGRGAPAPDAAGVAFPPDAEREADRFACDSASLAKQPLDRHERVELDRDVDAGMKAGCSIF
jgi:hypothetical protein